jgi:hypothetical protein
MFASSDRSKRRHKKLKIDQEKAKNLDLAKIHAPINSVTPNSTTNGYIFTNKNTVIRHLNETEDSDNEDSHTSNFFLL